MSYDDCISIQHKEQIMTNVFNFERAREDKQADKDQEFIDFILSQPQTMTAEQCSQARGLLGWSQEALAFRSGTSVLAISQFETGTRLLRDVTKQAIVFALEGEGLMLIPGHPPMRGDNVRGMTPNPRERKDFHLVE
jgi:DNA-binding transcriptional regulator YiaG